MFERFLTDPRALERHRTGPLADERRRYIGLGNTPVIVCEGSTLQSVLPLTFSLRPAR